jgi:hypothetical protein
MYGLHVIQFSLSSEREGAEFSKGGFGCRESFKILIRHGGTSETSVRSLWILNRPT